MKIRHVWISLTALSIGLMLTAAKAHAAAVEEGATVKFDYTLTVDGQQVDSSIGKEPVEFVYGEGTVIPGLASNIAGLEEGEEKHIVIEPEQAYGTVNPKLFRELPNSQLPADFTPEVGMVIEVEGPEGQKASGIVWAVKPESVVVNFNHPLAGKTLEFDVKVIDVR